MVGHPIVGMGRAGDGWLKWRPLSVFIALELGSRGVQGVQLTCWCIVHSVNAVLVRGAQWTLGRFPIHGWIYDFNWLASFFGQNQ